MNLHDEHTFVRAHLSNSSSKTEESTFSTLSLRVISTSFLRISFFIKHHKILSSISHIENTHNSSLADSFTSFDNFFLNLEFFFRCRTFLSLNTFTKLAREIDINIQNCMYFFR